MERGLPREDDASREGFGLTGFRGYRNGRRLAPGCVLRWAGRAGRLLRSRKSRIMATLAIDPQSGCPLLWVAEFI